MTLLDVLIEFSKKVHDRNSRNFPKRPEELARTGAQRRGFCPRTRGTGRRRQQARPSAGREYLRADRPPLAARGRADARSTSDCGAPRNALFVHRQSAGGVRQTDSALACRGPFWIKTL